MDLNSRGRGGARCSMIDTDAEKVATFTTSKPVVEVEAASDTPSLRQDTIEREIEAELDPEVAALPLNVRQLVSLDDDPNLPTITFRYFLLSIIFVVPGAFLSQMSYFRTTYAPYSIFIVQVASHYVGHLLADYLPARNVWLPLGCTFNLNPAPWSIKEHVLVTLTAASGATYNLGYTPISMAELYYGDRIHPAVAMVFMLTIVWIGYAVAAVARTMLLWEPQYVWPQALMQTTLFETFRKQDRHSALARKQMVVFFVVVAGMTAWQFLPEYVFPFLSSLALLCWVAPHNPVANFIGSGLGGMGFLNLSLDWSNINWNGSSILITPWWTQVILFLAFVFNCWVLIPAAKWGKLAPYSHGLMSNALLLANGTKYPTLEILTPSFNLNLTAYEHYGPVYMGPQIIWATFFDYAKLPSAFLWLATFGAPTLLETLKKLRATRSRSNGHSSTAASGIHHQYTDRLNVLMRRYEEVPVWWFLALFLAGFVPLLIIVSCGHMFVPVWTVFIGVATGLIVVIPLGWLYAVSNYQVAIGTFNELIYGYLVETKAGENHRHPCGPSTYGAIAGDAWYRAQYMLQDQKIGHYMHIPPRTVFFSQVFGTVLGVPVNYGVVRWVLSTKFEYLSGERKDPLNQWTGQKLVTSNTYGVQYAVIGPTRLFAQAIFRPLPYSFLVGAAVPVALYALHKLAPRKLTRSLRFDLWNFTIFCGGMSQFYGNVSTGYTSAFLGGYIAMRWVYRRNFEVWKRYNYIVAAALDAGFNLAMLLIFLFFGSGKQISMPEWWGNSAGNVERCFASDDA